MDNVIHSCGIRKELLFTEQETTMNKSPIWTNPPFKSHYPLHTNITVYITNQECVTYNATFSV